jgi:hypothetical protein
MKRQTALIALLLLITTWTTQAQTPATPKPAVSQPTAEQKARLQELARVANLKAQEAKSAQDQFMIALLSTLAELGLKPSETMLTWNEKNEPVFQRVEQAKTTPTPVPPKTEAKP